MDKPKRKRRFVYTAPTQTPVRQASSPPTGQRMEMTRVMGFRDYGRLEQRLIIAQAGRPDMKERVPLIVEGIPDD